jgi:hypothetical protein
MPYGVGDQLGRDQLGDIGEADQTCRVRIRRTVRRLTVTARRSWGMYIMYSQGSAEVSGMGELRSWGVELRMPGGGIDAAVMA